MVFAGALSAQPIIHSIQTNDSIIGQYEKFEVSLDLTASFFNPYDYDEIEVKASFISPNGQTISVDGFFMQEFSLLQNGNLTTRGEGFKVRFAPTQLGVWTYELSVRDKNGSSNYVIQQFRCIASTQTGNKGFVRINSTNYLSFDNGEPYIPIGENLAWQKSNAYTDYKDWIDKLSSNGANYFRLWHAHWGLGIEWKSSSNGFRGLRKYNEENCWYQDWLFDYCAEKGMYVMLCLQHHGPLSTQVNPNWGANPYNKANGGMCVNPADFFKDNSALSHTKNRFRYIVARWGYARSIMAWELFNEVEWTDQYQENQVEIADWHMEMAEWIKELDPNKHLLTTSFAKEENDPIIWSLPDIDFTQTHSYINSPHIERVLHIGSLSYLEKYAKPSLNAEFGIGLSQTLPAVDPNGIHFHNGMWGSLMGGGLGTAMSWWWDMYIDLADLYHHFSPISKVVNEIPFVAKNMQYSKPMVIGAKGDLSLIPTLGWGEMGVSSIEVQSNGDVYPQNPQLGIYLYGSQSNTLFRNPPVFSVDLPNAGSFTVKTAMLASNAPKIAIWLDGVKLLDENAMANTSYSILLPAGQHSIKVENTGLDWITIASYMFSGLGSAVDAYVLVADDKRTAAGWVLHNAYNHEKMLSNHIPDPLSGAEIIVDGFHDSTYFVKWYDCLTGALKSSQNVSAFNGQLRFPIPDLLWDFAFIVDEKPPLVSAMGKPNHWDFKVFPNPTQAGAAIKIETDEMEHTSVRIELLSMDGRLLSVSNWDTKQDQTYVIPKGLSAGLYYLKMSTSDKVGAKLLIII